MTRPRLTTHFFAICLLVPCVWAGARCISCQDMTDKVVHDHAIRLYVKINSVTLYHYHVVCVVLGHTGFCFGPAQCESVESEKYMFLEILAHDTSSCSRVKITFYSSPASQVTSYRWAQCSNLSEHRGSVALSSIYVRSWWCWLARAIFRVAPPRLVALHHLSLRDVAVLGVGLRFGSTSGKPRG